MIHSLTNLCKDTRWQKKLSELIFSKTHVCQQCGKLTYLNGHYFSFYRHIEDLDELLKDVKIQDGSITTFIKKIEEAAKGLKDTPYEILKSKKNVSWLNDIRGTIKFERVSIEPIGEVYQLRLYSVKKSNPNAKISADGVKIEKYSIEDCLLGAPIVSYTMLPTNEINFQQVVFQSDATLTDGRLGKISVTLMERGLVNTHCYVSIEQRRLCEKDANVKDIITIYHKNIILSLIFPTENTKFQPLMIAQTLHRVDIDKLKNVAEPHVESFPISEVPNDYIEAPWEDEDDCFQILCQDCFQTDSPQITIDFHSKSKDNLTKLEWVGKKFGYASTCRKCKGTGVVVDKQSGANVKCPDCGGFGTYYKVKDLKWKKKTRPKRE